MRTYARLGNCGDEAPPPLTASDARTLTPQRPRLLPIAMLVAALGVPFGCAAQSDLTNLSLEELLQVEVTTASRRAQRLTDTAAAAFVITAEDIARSGATSIPEVLRMVPGVNVARLSSSRWAVSARGFNGRFSNKLLVLMDGRSIYSPEFSGVFWEHEDTILEDVERIEVIRGPGAAMWGANAVNGVINIITRKAKDTQGGLVAAHAGFEERAGVALRYGAKAGGDGHFRVWGKAFRRDAAPELDDEEGRDEWKAYRAGFRWDQRLADNGRFSLIGAVADSRSEDEWLPPSFQDPYVAEQPVAQRLRSGNLLGRYEHTFAGGSQASVQAYVERMELEFSPIARGKRTTLDIDAQHELQWGASDLIWGVGYRYWRDEIVSGTPLDFEPQRRTQDVLSAFLHNEFSVVPEKWKLMVGAKLEHNSITGFEAQPNARLLWTPSPTQTLWGAVSRAVRLPSRGERDARVDLRVEPPSPATNGSPFPVLLRNERNPDLDSEKVTAFELGYRAQVASSLSLDAAIFYNRYKGLRAGTTLDQIPQFSFLSGTGVVGVFRTTPSNNLDASTRGVELAVDWHMAPWWRLQGAYTHFRMDGKRTGDSVANGTAELFEGSSPRNQLSLRSSMNLGKSHQLDVWVRRVGELPAIGVDAYTAVDVRFAWQVSKDLELSVVGQNLFDPRHVEGVVDFLPAQTMEIERAAFVKAKVRF